MKWVLMLLLLINTINVIADDYKYLIITPHNFYEAVLPLANWKNQKGLKTKIISIHSGLNSAAIRDTIKNYQPEYVLLVGDRNFIPFGKFYPNWSLYQNGTWTDQYYADTSDNGNYFDDIFVGRLPCNTSTQCSSMVNKILFYEQAKFTNNDWLLKATGIARDLENSPTGNYDSCYRSAIRDFKEQLMNYGFTQVDTLFQSETYDYRKVEDSITEGRGFVLYRGSTYSGTDNWNTPFAVNPEQINNDSMPSIIISPTCRTMFNPTSELSTAAGFRWMRNGDYENPKGAVAFWGTTTHYCARFFDQQTYWRNATTKGFFKSITEDSINILGKAINKAKYSAFQCCSLYTVGQDSHAVACSVAYMEWNLLGDPSMNLWTAVPKQLAVTYDTILNTSSQNFVVYVKDSLSQENIFNAFVCLTMDSIIYQSDYTDELGQVSFSIEPSYPGKLSITITKQNYIPYQGSAIVKFEHDVGCTKVASPLGSIAFGEIVTPACSVFNYGMTAETYRIRMKIGTFYEDTVLIDNHQPATFQYVQFTDWEAIQTGIHLVTCSTELLNDMNNINDVQATAIGCSITVYTIVASAGPNGSIYPNGSIVIAEGADTTFTIVPNLGYYISSLIVDGAGIEPMSSYTFENVTANHSIHTTFDNITYQLNITIEGNGSVEKNPDLFEYNHGSEVELRAIPDDNWLFTKWSGDTFALDALITIVMDDDKNICANFIYPGWQRKNDVNTVGDKNVKDGGALAIYDSIIFALQGANTQNFIEYNIINDTWIKKCSIPYVERPNGKLIKKNVKAGGALTVYDNKLYAFKGGNTAEFWCYLPDSNKWRQKLSIPETTNSLAKSSKVKAGGSLVTNSDSIYAFKGGNTNEFWMYVPKLNEWFQRKPLHIYDGKKVKDGGSLVLYNDTIFALIGGNTNHFYAYVPDTWLRKPDVRFGTSKTIKRKIKSGAALTILDNKIYALKGGGTKDFGYFDFTDYTWHNAETLPGIKKVKGGGALVSDNQHIYAFKGANTKEFYMYTPYNNKLAMAKYKTKEITNITQECTSLNINEYPLISVIPNLVTKSATVHYSVSKSGKILMQLFNSSGRLQRTLVDDYFSEGQYSITLNLKNLSKGVYFIKYRANNINLNQKIIIH